jgi:pilus assembly protein CpaB
VSSLVVGVLLALAAGLSVYLAVRGIQPTNTREVVPVLVAAANVPAGTTFDGRNATALLRVERRPAESVPAGALSTIVDVLGRTTGTALSNGAPVVDTLFTGLSTRPLNSSEMNPVAATMPDGQVAVAIPASDQTTVGGVVRPLDRVDLIASLSARQADGSSRVVTQALLRDVLVIAVASRPSTSSTSTVPQASTASAIVVAVTPQDALVVQQLLSTNTRIAFALRRPYDGVAETRPTGLEEIVRRFGLDAAP